MPELIYHKDELAVKSCLGLIGKSATLFGAKDKKGFCNVENQPALGTMTHCLVQGFGTLPMKHKVIEKFLEGCSKYDLTKEQFDDAYTNATDYLVDPKTYTGFNKTVLFSLPIQLKTSKINKAYESNYNRFFNYNWTTWFSVALISYWFLIFIIAGMINLLYFIFPKVINNTFNGSISKTFRRYISLPATVSRTHAMPFRFFGFEWIIPTRLESILVFGWFILALAFNISHIKHTEDNFIWKTRAAEMGRIIADRSGIMALYLIPVNVLFAGRNNFLQWVSGWSYSRMILLHRWTSRIMFAIVIVHSAAMSVSGVALGKYFTRNAKPYVQWGYVATVAGGIMCFHSLLMFRRRNYELFLLVHIILAAIFLAGGWLHVADDDMQPFYYAAVAAWCFDRALRLARLAAFGVQTATVELKSNETLRVTVPRPKYWKPFPGCHAFIHFIRPTMFWQSHPFTIVDTKVEDTDKHTITFYLKIKGGVTHGLYQYLAQQPSHTAMIKVCVEGPYGSRIPLDRFSNAVFIAGGNGVPGMYSEVISLAHRKTEATTRRIKFYWIIRHWKSIEWFHEELKKLEGTRVETIIYVTQPGSGLVLDDTSESDQEDSKEKAEELKVSEKGTSAVDYQAIANISKLKEVFPAIEFREGRPKIPELVHGDMAEMEGSTAIVSCAHASMVDDIRLAVIDNLGTSKDRVEYFEQIQTW